MAESFCTWGKKIVFACHTFAFDNKPEISNSSREFSLDKIDFDGF